MITFKDVQLSYNYDMIIPNLSFEIKSGEKVLFAGRSGTGKSTLFKMLLGYIEPSKGDILFEGTRLDKKNVWNIRKKVAYIDQDVSIGDGMVHDFLKFVSKLKTNSSLNITTEKIHELLSQFELSIETINKDIKDLSGGERQRLAIIVAILLERNIYLLDEVTSALDSNLKKMVVDYFVNKDHLTCLVISHDKIWLNNPLVKIFDMDTCTWK